MFREAAAMVESFGWPSSSLRNQIKCGLSKSSIAASLATALLPCRWSSLVVAGCKTLAFPLVTNILVMLVMAVSTTAEWLLSCVVAREMLSLLKLYYAETLT